MTLTVKETLEAVDAAGDVFQLEQKVMEDGKINLLDAPAVMAAFPALMKSIPAGIEGINKIPAEFLDLDSIEAKQIATKIAEKFNLEIGGAKAARISAALLQFIAAGMEVKKEIQS